MIKEIKGSKIKTGEEIVDDFFKEIANIENVDVVIANSLAELHADKKFTENNVINKIRDLRKQSDNKN